MEMLKSHKYRVVISYDNGDSIVYYCKWHEFINGMLVLHGIREDTTVYLTIEGVISIISKELRRKNHV